MAHVPKNPAIAMRDGVSPSCLALPQHRVVPWASLLDHLVERMPGVSRQTWLTRLETGQVLSEDGQALGPDAPYVNGARVYYWRDLPDESPIPFEAHVLFEDEHLVVADKPHFLPVTPGGRFVRETLLVRLKQRLNLPDLSPLHRIDRETAGLVVFSKRPAERDAYQGLFRERTVHKRYLAIAPVPQSLSLPCVRRSRIEEDEVFYRMRETEGEPNSETHIELLRTWAMDAQAESSTAKTTPSARCDEAPTAWGLYQLSPISGKRHQLRVHMNALGCPIVGDQFYPKVLRGPDEPEDFQSPLQLLAKTLSFTDPVTGQARHFESQRTL
jgi:tRNA pseudouridine32 synthase / 23S rRNA pseudouridine746 synthase